MTARRIVRFSLLAVLAALVLGAVGFGGWLFGLPPEFQPRRIDPATVPTLQHEYRLMLTALKPPKRQRPLVAILGSNDGTEITDYLMPTGILRRADVADVVTVSTGPGPVQLYPALTVRADETTAAFDARHPEGADYVIVPAMTRDDDPQVIGWLRDQASRGAVIVGVCAGAKVVGAAGLLDGRRATTHWYYRPELLARSPTMAWVPDRRLVVDHGIATTTGISASMPMMLTLVEAIAGADRASSLARDLGLARWDIWHDSEAFRLNRPFATTVLGNQLAFWRHERLDVALADGVDEVSLALVLDAWSRTYRSQAVAIAPDNQPIRTRHGVLILPDRDRQAPLPAAGNPGRSGDARQGGAASPMPVPRLADAVADRPADALEQTLRVIAGRYGQATAEVVAMQLEYPWQHTPR